MKHHSVIKGIQKAHNIWANLTVKLNKTHYPVPLHHQTEVRIHWLSESTSLMPSTFSSTNERMNRFVCEETELLNV